MMFCDKSLELVKELYNNDISQQLPPYNDERVRQALRETSLLFEENQDDVNKMTNGHEQFVTAVQLRHSCVERNKRILLAYFLRRLSRIGYLRWELGSVLPPDVKDSLSQNEIIWFSKYNRMLAKYMGSVGGLDLTQDTRPPMCLYLAVRCLHDYGGFESDDGEIVKLKRNNQYYLPRSKCENLIRQGILEHVVS